MQTGSDFIGRSTQDTLLLKHVSFLQINPSLQVLPMIRKFVIVSMIVVIASLFVSPSLANAQTLLAGEEEVPTSVYAIDSQKKPSTFIGLYQFGFSEGEWILRFNIVKGKPTVTYNYSIWSDKKNTWIPQTKVIKNAAIVGWILTGAGLLGVFVTDPKYKTNHLVLTKGYQIGDVPEVSRPKE